MRKWRSSRAVLALPSMVLGLVVYLAGAAGPAAAHGMPRGVEVAVDRVTPSVPGLTFTGEAIGSERLAADNTTDKMLVVLGASNQPFLEIGPGGVWGNLASPSWYLSNSAEHNAAVPTQASAHAAPDWLQVSTVPQWSWFDLRIHAPQTLTQVASVHQSRSLLSWTMPMLYNGSALVVSGHDEYAPPVGSFEATITGAVPPGLAATPLAGMPLSLSLRLTNLRAMVSVLGADGEPFGQLSSAGASVNLASPTWQLTGAFENTPVAGLVGPDAQPRYFVYNPNPTLVWIDPRMAYPSPNPPARVVARGVRQVLVNWSIPLVDGGATYTLTGNTSWVPPASRGAASGGHSALVWALPVGGVVALAGVALYFQGRRPARRGPRRAPSSRRPVRTGRR